MWKRSIAIAGCLAALGCTNVGDVSEVDAGDGDGDDTPEGLLVEAETSFNRTSVDMLHQWIDADAEAGFSGAGYAEVLPNDGESCGEFTRCGASMSYTVDIPETGTYFVYFHVRADDLTDDSIAWSVNAGDVELLAHTQLGDWEWIRSQTTFTAQPGPVVFTVHMAEDGEKLDALVLSTDGEQ